VGQVCEHAELYGFSLVAGRRKFFGYTERCYKLWQ